MPLPLRPPERKTASRSAGTNTIIGIAENNVINGDVGADTMLGGAGNDSFYVDNAGDVVSEIANQGTDHDAPPPGRLLGRALKKRYVSGV